MKRISIKNLANEIEKVKSYTEQKRQEIETAYHYFRGEQDFLLQQMHLFDIKQAELKKVGKFRFNVVKKLSQHIVSPHMLFRIELALRTILKEKSLQDYSPSSPLSERYSLERQFLENKKSRELKQSYDDLDLISLSFAHLYEEIEFGLGILHINIFHFLRNPANDTLEKIKELLNIK